MGDNISKIGIIDRSSSGWSAGESYTKSVLRSLGPLCREAKVELVLFTPGEGKAFEEIPDLRIVPFPPSANKEGLVDALEKEKPSVVFPVLDDPVHKMSFPVIAWIPDLQHRFLPHFFNGAEIEYRDKLFGSIARQAVFTVASSLDSREALVGQGFASAEAAQSLSFPSSLIEEKLPPDPLPVLGKYQLPRKFALVANQFWKHKNHEVVVQALARIKQEMPDLVLVLTGMPTDFRDLTNSSLSALLQQIAAASLNEQVRILGQVPRSDLVALMRIAAVIIQPSCFEGWSTSVQDAKALGRPIICSDLKVHREQAPGALGFFGVDQPEQLAQILNREWSALQAGPDFGREQVSLAQELSVAETFGHKLFALCRQAAESGRIPRTDLEPVAQDLQTWLLQQKDQAIHDLLSLAEKNKKEIIRLRHMLPGQSESGKNLGAPSLETLSGLPDGEVLKLGLTPEELKIREVALASLEEMLEEKELLATNLRVFNWWKLGRFFKKIIRPKKPVILSNSELRRSLWHGYSRYHHFESLLHEPPFFCGTALYLKFRKPFQNPRLSFFSLIYKKVVKHCPSRLGILSQKSPEPLKGETFPSPRLKEEELPSISIVTPSYNQAHFIEETLRSVLDQNYPKLEYYVQDGGSKDHTVDILERFRNRLSGFESAPDKGQSDAIVKGFQHSTGEIMAWLNSDDVLMQGSLRFVGEYFAQHPEVDVIYGHRVITDENSLEIGRWFLPSHNKESLKWVDFVPQETLFWRRSAWEKTGGLDPSFQFALDWDLLLRFENLGLNIQRLPYFLGCFRVHSTQKTSSIINSTGLEEMERLRLREHGRTFRQAVVDLHAKPIIVRSYFCQVLWKKGFRI